MAKKQARIYTVSQINALIKAVMDENLPSGLIVSGEITGWKVHSSGHCYFTLKDEGSQIPCVMWASSFNSVKFNPENGLAVFAKGYVDVYPPQGKYQFYVEKLDIAGLGDLQFAFEQMVAKLKKEGLFDDQHKKPLPKYPQRIAILTSDSGAAIGDITTSIYGRWPVVELLLFPVPVQGDGAAEKIAKMLNKINIDNDTLNIDVAIVGRGGGSLEDLWAFNEEVLARAIFNSAIPVISAVGHEYDTTIADLVADARASTPTKAGVIAVPDKTDVLNQLNGFEKSAQINLYNKISLAKKNLERIAFSHIFRNPLKLLDASKQYVDELISVMNIALKNILTSGSHKILLMEKTIAGYKPDRYLTNKKTDITRLAERLINAQQAAIKSSVSLADTAGKLLNAALIRALADKNAELNSIFKHLKALNPKTILSRGYSITRLKNTGKVLLSSKDLNNQDIILTELADSNIIQSRLNS